MDKTVQDVNIDDEHVIVPASYNLIEVSKAMASAGIPDVVVVDENNKVLGALDDYDIVSKCLAEEKNPLEMTAKDIMYVSPSVKMETKLERVHEMLQELMASTLPVVDDEHKLLGVITIHDIFDAYADEVEEES